MLDALYSVLIIVGTSSLRKLFRVNKRLFQIESSKSFWRERCRYFNLPLVFGFDDFDILLKFEQEAKKIIAINDFERINETKEAIICHYYNNDEEALPETIPSPTGFLNKIILKRSTLGWFSCLIITENDSIFKRYIKSKHAVYIITNNLFHNEGLKSCTDSKNIPYTIISEVDSSYNMKQKEIIEKRAKIRQCLNYIDRL